MNSRKIVLPPSLIMLLFSSFYFSPLWPPACDEAHEPAAAGLPRCRLFQSEDVESEQLGPALQADAGFQLHSGPADQQHPHQALRQLPGTGRHTSHLTITEREKVDVNPLLCNIFRTRLGNICRFILIWF